MSFRAIGLHLTMSCIRRRFILGFGKILINGDFNSKGDYFFSLEGSCYRTIVSYAAT